MKIYLRGICSLLLATALSFGPQPNQKIETLYDQAKDLTTVRLGPVRLSGDRDIYHSLDFSLSHQYPGTRRIPPKQILFELVSVIKARRLNTDLYVVFLEDGQPVHFSSNRSAVRTPVPGRLWIGERLEFLIPFDDFVRLTQAKSLSIKLGNVSVVFDEKSRDALRTFLEAAK